MGVNFIGAINKKEFYSKTPEMGGALYRRQLLGVVISSVFWRGGAYGEGYLCVVLIVSWRR